MTGQSRDRVSPAIGADRCELHPSRMSGDVGSDVVEPSAMGMVGRIGGTDARPARAHLEPLRLLWADRVRGCPPYSWWAGSRSESGGASGQILPSVDPNGLEPLCRFQYSETDAQAIGTGAGAERPRAGLVLGRVGVLMTVDWPIVEAIIRGSRMVLLYGPPGTGKTTAACGVGDPRSVYNLTLTDETAASELRGHYLPKGSEWLWSDGPVMRAWREGSRLVLNEIDHASGDALDFLHAVLDDPKVASFTLPTSETVRPGETFGCVATMNGVPEDLPTAIRDRFAIRLEIDQPHPDALAGLPDFAVDAVMGTTCSDDDDARTSLRSWRSFLDLQHKIGDEDAARAVFHHRAVEVLNAIKLAGER